MIGRALTIAAATLAAWVGVASAQGDRGAGPDPRGVIGAPEGQTLGGVGLDAEAKAIAGLLRCPVCQGLSVADSPSSMAVKMRGEVRDLVAQGYTKDQVLAYFEHSYGEFVRLQPKLQGVNWIVWLAPLAALGAGLLLIRHLLSKASSPREVALPVEGASDEDLAPYLERVREAVNAPGRGRAVD